jgi:hypothetical protein
MIGDPGFDPSTFNKTLSWEDYNNQNYENKYSGNYRTSESEMQMDSFGSSFDEEIEETTTTSTTTTTTTTTTTEELTTVYEYEEPVSTSTSLPTTTTLMYIDYDGNVKFYLTSIYPFFRNRPRKRGVECFNVVAKNCGNTLIPARWRNIEVYEPG